MRYDLSEHLCRQIAFSRSTFGPGPRTAGVIDHIRKELDEVVEAGGAPEEWVDVVILALDGLTRSILFADGGCGSTDDAAAEAALMIREKQGINERRSWPDWRAAPADRAIEHDGGSGSIAENSRTIVAAAEVAPEPKCGLRARVVTGNRAHQFVFVDLGTDHPLYVIMAGYTNLFGLNSALKSGVGCVNLLNGLVIPSSQMTFRNYVRASDLREDPYNARPTDFSFDNVALYNEGVQPSSLFMEMRNYPSFMAAHGFCKSAAAEKLSEINLALAGVAIGGAANSKPRVRP